jgi:opacity protein-like surface antigen
MKFKLLAGAAIAAVCVSSGASAADTGWYGAVDMGYHAPDSFTLSSSNNASSHAPSLSTMALHITTKVCQPPPKHAPVQLSLNR